MYDIAIIILICACAHRFVSIYDLAA